MRQTQQKKAGEFRTVRCLSIEDNLLRLKKHVWRLERKMRGANTLSRFRMQNLRAQRAAVKTTVATVAY